VPLRQGEFLGRPGKQADGSARTREAKLGCVFTQAGLDKKGRPARDLDSTRKSSQTHFYLLALKLGLEDRASNLDHKTLSKRRLNPCGGRDKPN